MRNYILDRCFYKIITFNQLNYFFADFINSGRTQVEQRGGEEEKEKDKEKWRDGVEKRDR